MVKTFKTIGTLIFITVMLAACAAPVTGSPDIVHVTTLSDSCENYLYKYEVVLSTQDESVTAFKKEKCDETGNIDIAMTKGAAGDFSFKLMPEYNRVLGVKYEYGCEFTQNGNVSIGECNIEGVDVGFMITKTSLVIRPPEDEASAGSDGPLYTMEQPVTQGGATIYRIRGSFDKVEVTDGHVDCFEGIQTGSSLAVYYESGSANITFSGSGGSYSTLGGSLTPIDSNTTLTLTGHAFDSETQSDRQTLAVLCYAGEKIGLQVSFSER